MWGTSQNPLHAKFATLGKAAPLASALATLVQSPRLAPLREELCLRRADPGGAHADRFLEVRADLPEHFLVKLDVVVGLPDSLAVFDYRRPIRR